MTDERLRFLQEWSKARAKEVRHFAAAMGWPAEYAFFKRRGFLEAELRRDLPDESTNILDLVCSDCQRPDGELSLDEINRIRAEYRYHALDFIPDVEARPNFRPPHRREPHPKHEEMDRFHAWMVERVSTAYHRAAASGGTPEHAMFGLPSMLVQLIIDLFPGLSPAWCLQELEFGLMFYKPETLDPKIIDEMRSLSATIKGVGDEIARRMAVPEKPPFKN